MRVGTDIFIFCKYCAFVLR